MVTLSIMKHVPKQASGADRRFGWNFALTGSVKETEEQTTNVDVGWRGLPS
jgi:hypothetical protein